MVKSTADWVEEGTVSKSLPPPSVAIIVGQTATMDHMYVIMAKMLSDHIGQIVVAVVAVVVVVVVVVKVVAVVAVVAVVRAPISLPMEIAAVVAAVASK